MKYLKIIAFALGSFALISSARAQLSTLNENFDSTPDGQLPAGWDTQGSKGLQPQLAVAGSNKGVYSVFNPSDGINETSWFLFTPQFDGNLGQKTLTFSFLNLSGNARTMEVGIVNKGVNAPITLLTINDPGTNANKQTKTIDFSQFNQSLFSTNRHIVFRFNENGPNGTNGGADLGIDDVVVSEPNVAPTNITLSNTSINENVAIFTTVGTLSTTDGNAGDSHSYSLSGSESQFFRISGSSLQTNSQMNFENRNSYTFDIITNDGNGGTFSKSFTINVNDLNEQPGAPIPSNTLINRGSAVGATVGTVSVPDEDTGDTHSFSISGGSDASFFTFDGNILKTTTAIDENTSKTLSINVTATDQGGLSQTGIFTIRVNDEPSDIRLNVSPATDTLKVGNISTGTIIQLLVDDPDTNDNHTLAIEQNITPPLAIDGNNNLTVPAGSDFTALKRDTTVITIKATDSNGLTFSKTFPLLIIEVIRLTNTTVEISQTAGAVVGEFRSDFQNNGLIPQQNLALSGADAASFEINTNSQLVTKVPLDGSGKTQFNIEVGLLDDQGNTVPFLTGKVPYTITLTGGGGEPVLSVADDPSFEIFPNPTSGGLIVRSDQLIRGIEILDLNGRMIKQLDFPILETKKIDLTTVKPGTYLLKTIDAKGSVTTRKFIKK